MKYELHPACAAWPLMAHDVLTELAEDIRVNGLHEPITLTSDGLLLDGRNRVEACEMVGIEPTTIVYDGDPVDFSISKNRHRRHLDKTDLALAGTKLATLKRGGDGSNQYTAKAFKKAFAENSDAAIAKELGVSETLIEAAKTLERDATPEVLDLVKNKKAVGIQTAANYVRRTPKDQQVANVAVIKDLGGRVRPRAVRALNPRAATPEQRAEILERFERGESRMDITRAVIGPNAKRQSFVVQHAIDEELARQEGYAKAKEEGPIDASTLPLTAQKRLEAAIASHIRQLNADFRQNVEEAVKHSIETVVLPSLKKREEEANLIRRYMLTHGVMDRKTYRKIWSCLHPDRVQDLELKARFQEAFDLFTRLEVVLIREKEDNLPKPGLIPSTYEELMKRRAEVSAARAAARDRRKAQGDGAIVHR